ncbi:hypothetical protein SAY86_015088 [Trapa natans]|uniref:Uncharacterized protein n=1 Tax=Trapa natans TaxID=22666 RepID=A0AAN7KE55_TRANT|nr:hypothetical protein SAY86_015088 [Trapa natans]
MSGNLAIAMRKEEMVDERMVGTEVGGQGMRTSHRDLPGMRERAMPTTCGAMGVLRRGKGTGQGLRGRRQPQQEVYHQEMQIQPVLEDCA